MKENIYSFFFNTFNFSIYKIWKMKTVWAVLIFDRFSTSRFFFFSFFTGELSSPGAGWNQHLVPTLDLSKLQILLFLRVSYLLPELTEISILFKLKIPFKFLWHVPAFSVRRPCRPIIRLFFFHHLAESRHPIDLDFCHFNRLKCKGYS